MNNYNKLKNSFEEIGLLTFIQNIDKYIDLINQGELNMVDILYMLTEKEKEFG